MVHGSDNHIPRSGMKIFKAWLTVIRKEAQVTSSCTEDRLLATTQTL
jgi:hypothetical protein